MPFFLVPVLVIGGLFLILYTIELAKRVKKMERQFADFRKQTHRVIVSHKEQIELLKDDEKGKGKEKKKEKEGERETVQ
jgi:hypothetical protein